MKKLLFTLLLCTFFLSACKEQKPEVEIPLPDQPPNLDQMQPIGNPS